MDSLSEDLGNELEDLSRGFDPDRFWPQNPGNPKEHRRAGKEVSKIRIQINKVQEVNCD
jgi:hypothetical protein